MSDITKEEEVGEEEEEVNSFNPSRLNYNSQS